MKATPALSVNALETPMSASALALFAALLLQPAADPAAVELQHTGPALEVRVEGNACVSADAVKSALGAELSELTRPNEHRAHVIATTRDDGKLEVRMSLRDEESWVKDEVFALPHDECAAVPSLIALKAKRAVLALPGLTAPDEAGPAPVENESALAEEGEPKGPLPHLNFVGTTLSQYGGAYVAALALGYISSFLAFLPVVGLPLAILVRTLGIGYAASAFGESFGDKRSNFLLPAAAAFVVELGLTTVGLVVYLGGIFGGLAVALGGPVLLYTIHPYPLDTPTMPLEIAGSMAAGYAMIFGGIFVGLAPIVFAGPLAATAAIATHNLAGTDKGEHTGNLVLPHLLESNRSTSRDAE